MFENLFALNTLEEVLNSEEHMLDILCNRKKALDDDSMSVYKDIKRHLENISSLREAIDTLQSIEPL